MARIIGTPSANTLRGKSVADDLYGQGGNDTLYGYGGDDDLTGGAGNDRLSGGTGNDELHGGAGRDTFVFTSGRDEIEDFSGRDDTIVIDTKLGVKSFSELMARAKTVDGGEDVRFDFGKGNTLTLDDTKLSSLKASHFVFTALDTAEPKDPLSGDNTLTGNGRANTLSGGDGNDMISGRGGDDRLLGDAGNDRLWGGAGNDRLSGGTGNDRLDGGDGRNELEGGFGRDTFVFRSGVTEIEDFRAGTDRIEIAKALGVPGFAALKATARTADGGEDLVFDFGSHELRLEDTRLSELSASDFLFV